MGAFSPICRVDLRVRCGSILEAVIWRPWHAACTQYATAISAPCALGSVLVVGSCGVTDGMMGVRRGQHIILWKAHGYCRPVGHLSLCQPCTLPLSPVSRHAQSITTSVVVLSQLRFKTRWRPGLGHGLQFTDPVLDVWVCRATFIEAAGVPVCYCPF